MIKYCIFDLDGTILDTITTITYYVNKTLDGEGLSHITAEQAKVFAGNGAYMLIKRTLAYHGITDEDEVLRVLDIYKRAYDEEPLYLTAPFPGINEALADLKHLGYKLGVVSNKPHTATLPIVEHFFPGLFDGISGALDGVPMKPAPDIPRAILEKMGGKPDECAFVGDTYVDMVTGTNLGAKLRVGVLWGFRNRDELVGAGADVVIGGVDDLVRAVQNG